MDAQRSEVEPVDKQPTRSLRWNLRVSEEDDRLVRAASRLGDVGLASFVREAALNEAHRALTDRTTFDLNDESWKRLNEMLERPASVPPGLAELFSRPPVFK